MPKGTAQIRCLHRSCSDSTDSALQTAAAAVAVRSRTPQAQAFRRGNASFLVAEGAAGYGRRKTTTRCLRVAAAAACAASLLQQQQQTWLRTRSSSSSTAFIASPSVAGSDCPLLVALDSDASESAATHVQQQQQHRQHQQPQKWHHQRPPFAGKMRPGCMPLLGKEAAAGNPAANKAAAAGEAAGAAASTGMPSEEAEVAAAPEGGEFVQLDKASFCKHEEATCLRVPLHQLQELSKALRKYIPAAGLAACALRLRLVATSSFRIPLRWLCIPRKQQQGGQRGDR